MTGIWISLNAKPVPMKKTVRQNPIILWPAVILSCAGAMSFLIPSLSPGLQLCGICMFIAGVFLQRKGTGTQFDLEDDGIKFGFTKISWDSIDHIDFDSEARIVIVTRFGVRRRFALTRWHYHPSDWQSLCERLGKVQPA
jgi:hypothetical protein